jgi:hypothetical protein
MMTRTEFTLLERVYRYLMAARSTLGSQITIPWLARALVEHDGGPFPDLAQLGGPLRTCGFRRVRQRRGPYQLERRVMTWLAPSVKVNKGGRPRRALARGGES